MHKVGIIIVNFNGQNDTDECLDSLEKVNISNLELQAVIVDNGSEEKFKLKKEAYKNLKVQVIRSEVNLGFSGGNNLGIKQILDDVDYFLLLNNDTVVEKNLIKELVKAAESSREVGIVAPKIYFAPGFEFHKDRYKKSDLGKVIWYAGGIMDWNNVIGSHRGVDEIDSGQYEHEELTQFASGCCLLLKKQVVEKVGIFDDRYFLYYEESDLCERVKRKGYTILYAPKAILWHKNAQTAGGSGSALQDYYITRNRMLFGNTYAPFRTKLALFRESLRILKRGRKWQKKGIKDYYMKNFGKGSYKNEIKN